MTSRTLHNAAVFARQSAGPRVRGARVRVRVRVRILTSKKWPNPTRTSGPADWRPRELADRNQRSYFVNNLLFDFSSGVQGRSPGRGSGGRSPPQLKVVTSNFYAFLVVIHNSAKKVCAPLRIDN